MSIKLGNADVSFRLGATTPAAVYLGAVEVWTAATVPGAPTITSAVFDTESEKTIVFYTPPEDDGNAPITDYYTYFDSVQAGYEESGAGYFSFDSDRTGQDCQMSAVNSVGEGGLSAAVEVVLV